MNQMEFGASGARSKLGRSSEYGCYKSDCDLKIYDNVSGPSSIWKEPMHTRRVWKCMS